MTSLGLFSRLPSQLLDDRLDARAVEGHPRDPAAVLLAEDDPAVGGEGLAVGRAGPLAEHLDRPVRAYPVGPLGLDVLEQGRAVGAPEGPLGELEPVGHDLDGVARHQPREPRVAQ